MHVREKFDLHRFTLRYIFFFLLIVVVFINKESIYVVVYAFRLCSVFGLVFFYYSVVSKKKKEMY